ncbi:MAG: protease complex subunit PrcB family protein [Chlorobi bacterium]|nr:protease complex subunit PrcB family protein [Chlorobiota bacterium]MCI0717345.1 protease complex subunit PrcB family protein [Chlorobiota bacterium]
MASKFCYILILFFAFAELSCSNQGEEEVIVPFEVIHGGSYCAIGEKKQVICKNNDDYQKLMNEVYKDLDQMPIIPEVDFSKNYVVAVFMGAKNTGGYAINFDKVIRRTADLTVSVFETSPGAKCIVTQAVTHPYEIAKIPKIDKNIKFKTKLRTNECE